MNMHTRTDWGPTVRLATTMSILSALIGVALVRLAGVPESAVIVGVMVIGCAVSLATSTGARGARPEPLRIRAHDRRSAA